MASSDTDPLTMNWHRISAFSCIMGTFLPGQPDSRRPARPRA